MARNALIAAVLLAGCGLAVSAFLSRPHRTVVERPVTVADDYSNIHPADYVGPQSCAKCHAAEYEQWFEHPHRKMNQNASADSILGDFSGRQLEYGLGRVVFEQQDGQYLMSLFEDDHLTRQYRVTRTVGSTIEQMYIGVQTVGPEPAGHVVYSAEGKLPFAYWFQRGHWLPELYFDSDRQPEAELPPQMTAAVNGIHRALKWDQTCLYCHNTYPYQHRVHFGEGLGFPREMMQFQQGPEVVKSWGPATPDRLVTLGISCESCHFGGREHAVGQREMRYVPHSPQLQLAGLDAKTSTSPTNRAFVINSICSQCHCAKITQYPNGAGTWNSREALDFTSSACSSQLKCTDCHNPHQSKQHGGLLDLQHTVDTCLKCHPQFQAEEQRLAHTRHAPDAGVSCLDCHMPKIVQGLEDAVRTHHISSPSNVAMLSRAAPNACNLCHLDRSVRWTVNELNQGWGCNLKIDSDWYREHAAGLERPLGEIWLQHRFPAVRLIAATAYSQSKQGAANLPRLLERLKDPQAVNRMFALFAVERVIGRQLTAEEYTPTAAAARRNRQVDALVQRGNALTAP